MTRPTPTSSESQVHPLPAPQESRVLDTDVGAIIGALTLVVVGLWSRHGGVTSLGDSAAKTYTSLAQLTGLLCSEAGLLGLILITRTPLMERRYGLDRMFNWHRLLGEAMAIFLALHIAFGVAAWAIPGGTMNAIQSLTGEEPYMALTSVGSVIVLLVTISSLKWFRNKLSYEMWYFVHLTAYFGLAASFSHQIVLGTDFADDSLARGFWVAIHVALVAWIIWSRWGRFFVALARPLRVSAVTHEAQGITSVVLSGAHLRKAKAQGGQFYLVRQLVKGRWWQSNPFSLSAQPTTAGLRFTVKSRGESSNAFTNIALGTRVIVEGPYGVCTPDVVNSEKVLLVGGGIGIGPVMSFLEQLTPQHEPIVLYRVSSEQEMSQVKGIEGLATARNGSVQTLVGPRATLKVADPFSADALLKAVPDLAQRVVIVAGPESMVKAVQRGARAAGVPVENIHAERAWW
ncbi:ferric reductase-like transmembrane domain-containing protein [bacterium]|nr:ferric reductase-like transmembrane domain-containing protein [bacterium]